MFSFFLFLLITLIVGTRSNRLIDTFESPHRGGSNEYPQSMFESIGKAMLNTPANPTFTI